MAAGNHTFYNGLLGLAETFRTSNPPKIRQCIQCLQSVFHFQPSVAMQACTNLQLGKLLFVHTKNVDLARSHLEKSVSLSFEVYKRSFQFFFVLHLYNFLLFSPGDASSDFCILFCGVKKKPSEYKNYYN